MRERLSASKNLEHSLSLHREKKAWFIFQSFPKKEYEPVEDVLTLGDVVKVVCLGKDKMGRISFSMKDVAE